MALASAGRGAGRPETRRRVGARKTALAPYSAHRILDARSLALHCLIARKISRDPRLLEVARRNLGRWLRARRDDPPRVYLEWRRIVSQPWPVVAAVLTELSENATRLRQSSPFVGVLTQAERRRVYAAFRG